MGERPDGSAIKSDGTVASYVQKYGNTALSLSGAGVFEISPPESLRSESAVFCNLRISPGLEVSGEPTENVEIAFGGAVIGFSLRDRDETLQAAEVLALHSPDGVNSEWIETGILSIINSEKGRSPQLQLGVRLDNDEGTWDLYLRDKLVWTNFGQLSGDGLRLSIHPTEFADSIIDDIQVSLGRLNSNDKDLGRIDELFEEDPDRK